MPPFLLLECAIDTPCVVGPSYDDDPIPDYGGAVTGWSYVEILIGDTLIGTSNDFPLVCNGSLWQLWEVNGCLKEMYDFGAYMFCDWFSLEIVSLIFQKMNTKEIVKKRLVGSCPCRWEILRPSDARDPKSDIG